MKPVLFLLNDRKMIKNDGTNITLMKACSDRGHEVYVTDVLHLNAVSATQLFAEAIRLPKTIFAASSTPQISVQLKSIETTSVNLGDVEAVFIRTTPGKDILRAWSHRFALEIMGMADEEGVRVFNEPAGLQKASSKLYTVRLPAEYVPKTMVCHTLATVDQFAKELDGPFVIKPLLGSQGRDVFFFDGPASLNTRQVVDILGRTDYLVVQEFLPEASEGDIRVLTLDDKILEPDRAMGIRRTPGVGEMRSNVSLGGTASVVSLSARQVEICNEIAKHLHGDGIRFAGLDLIGERIVEVNVFSPSGLQEYDRQFDGTISSHVVDQLIGQGSD